MSTAKPRWERGSLIWGYWREQTRLGFVYRRFDKDGYEWSLDYPPDSPEIKVPTLAAAKRAVEKAIREREAS